MPNPSRGFWYGKPDEPLLGSPCWGCRRGFRRAYVVDLDGGLLQHHLVRGGVTIDCVGLNYRIQCLFAEEVDCIGNGKREGALC